MISNDDEREFKNYIKQFIIKVCQSIVLARSTLQESKSQNSGSTISSQLDWFNISIGEYPSLKEQIKSFYNGSHLDLNNAIDISVFINSIEGKFFLIEKWRILMVKKPEEIQSGWKRNFYNHLTTIIKSVLIISHSNFVYRLCKLSTNNGYSVSCEIEIASEAEDVDTLDFNQQKIGVAICPIGTIEMHLFWKEDFSLVNLREIEVNKTKLDKTDTNPKHTNQIGNSNGPISLAYGCPEIKRCPAIDCVYIPFNNLINFEEKKPIEAVPDHLDKECLQLETNLDETGGNPSDKIHIVQSLILKRSSYLTNNIKTPFAFTKNDAQLFYLNCSDIQALNIFEDMGSVAPRNIELDDLLLTFKNNAKPFTTFITQLVSMDSE